jgi:hypothetical protein
LRREVESLLAYQDQAETYLEKPAFQAVAQVLAGEGAGLLVNRMLGRYHLLSLIGRGGMGEVYCAVDTRLNRLVAVKILPEYFAKDPERVRRFEQEARAIAGLNHPGICTLHDVGSDDGLHYLVFEYWWASGCAIDCPVSGSSCSTRSTTPSKSPMRWLTHMNSA